MAVKIWHHDQIQQLRNLRKELSSRNPKTTKEPKQIDAQNTTSTIVRDTARKIYKLEGNLIQDSKPARDVFSIWHAPLLSWGPSPKHNDRIICPICVPPGAKFWSPKSWLAVNFRRRKPGHRSYLGRPKSSGFSETSQNPSFLE